MKPLVVAVALSGGVDSLVSGFLLKKKYKNVFGIHFTTGYEQKQIDLSLLEKQLGFPVTGIDLSKAFEQKVVHYFIQTYLSGKTPNPCLVCNQQIKFGVLLDKAQQMGADILATGHYATIVNSHTHPEKTYSQAYLKKGKDPQKDQSYFLSLLSGRQLEHIVFPLAGMTKKQVKQIALDNGISPLFPSESQDICFIHDNNFSKFIIDKQQILPQPGDIVDLSGTVVGRHTGLHRYTIGQRRGLNCPASEPYYVKQIDIKQNKLVVCFKKDLSCDHFEVDQINWNYSLPAPISNMTTKIRYSHNQTPSTLTITGSKGTVNLKTAQNAVTPGQAAVFYKDDRVLGAGIIQ